MRSPPMSLLRRMMKSQRQGRIGGHSEIAMVNSMIPIAAVGWGGLAGIWRLPRAIAYLEIAIVNSLLPIALRGG